MDLIGVETFGGGPATVIVLNDWMCDTSTWDGARAYLDGARYTWAFADLRGYGRSRGRPGAFTLEEAVGDVIALADARGWSRFTIVGHSMSSLVALNLAQEQPDRIERVVVITPPPPSGFGVDDATLEGIRGLARGDDAKRLNYLRQRFGARLSEAWTKFKLDRWRASSDADAVAAYAEMFSRRGLPDPTRGVACAVLAITGEEDIELMRREAVTRFLAPFCARLQVVPLTCCGHYPMQEAPPLLVATVERFLGEG